MCQKLEQIKLNIKCKNSGNIRASSKWYTLNPVQGVSVNQNTGPQSASPLCGSLLQCLAVFRERDSPFARESRSKGVFCPGFDYYNDVLEIGGLLNRYILHYKFKIKCYCHISFFWRIGNFESFFLIEFNSIWICIQSQES